MMMNVGAAAGRCLVRRASQSAARQVQQRTRTTNRLMPFRQTAAAGNVLGSPRLLSSSSSTPSTPSNLSASDEFDQNIKVQPPDKLSVEMAEGIADATQFYVKYGVARQQFVAIAKSRMSVLEKWQKMLHIFLTTQVHVINGLGYPPNEEGLTKYAKDLQQCLASADPTMRDVFTSLRRDTWRELVATTFDLDVNDIPTLEIVDARNIMHKISSKMQEPEMLEYVQKGGAKIHDADPQMEVTKKHAFMQDVIVNRVYLGGEPSILDEAGFGSGEKAYAKLQCAMSDYEDDPLIAQYASAAFMRLWEAAGLDIDSITGPGLPTPIKPM